MSVSTQDGRGAAVNNVASKILDVTEAAGPVTLIVRNEGPGPIVVSVKNKATGVAVATDDETAVSSEDTQYDGDNSTLVFSGEALDNVPIIPGSVTIIPQTGNDSVNLFDRDGDGKLYTADSDEDLAGTIDYATGDLGLNYPSGKAPNTGDINASYSYAGESQVPLGSRTIRIASNPPEKDLTVSAAGLSDNSIAQITAVVSF